MNIIEHCISMATDQGRSSTILSATLPAAGMPVSGPINTNGVYISRSDNTSAAKMTVVQSKGIQDPVSYPAVTVLDGTAGEPDLSSVCLGMNLFASRTLLSSPSVTSLSVFNFREWSYARGSSCVISGVALLEVGTNVAETFPTTLTYRLTMDAGVRAALAGTLGSAVDGTLVGELAGLARATVLNSLGTLRYHSWVHIAPGLPDFLDIVFNLYDTAPYDNVARDTEVQIYFEVSFDILP